MPGDPLQHLLPGDEVPLNTDRDNTIAHAAAEVRAHGFNKAARKGKRQFAQSGIVLVKNVSGVDLDRFCVVGLGDPIIGPAVNLTEYYNEVTFKGHIPTEALHLGKFAILQEPCANGKIVPAVVSGVTPVRLARYDATHECADVFDGDPNQLLADRCGSAQILWAIRTDHAREPPSWRRHNIQTNN